MTERIKVQEHLDERQLSRNFIGNYWDFRRNAGFILDKEILDRLKEGDVTVLDAGCGSGLGIEDLVRHLNSFVRNKDYAGKLTGIGIDLNPLPEIIPKCLPNEEKQLGQGIVAKLSAGDVCRMPLKDNFVDIGYSVATLIYVLDTLRALEEGYRVLKEGGVFIWDICQKEISFLPEFAKILEETHGAKDVFTYIQSPFSTSIGHVICRKNKSDTFNGFPFQVTGEAYLCSPPEPDSFRAHYKNAIYGKQ